MFVGDGERIGEISQTDRRINLYANLLMFG
jgi:hypothetical protein